MKKEEFANTIATLVTNGFHIYKVDRLSPENLAVSTYKFDRLGAEVRYTIMFSDDTIETPSMKSLITISKSYSSKPLFVNDHIQHSGCANYTNKSFFEFFGGIINTGLILIPNLPEILDELGHNRLPKGLARDPDDLHELYASDCLQFLLASPSRRYGKERLFESLPDGVVLGKNLMILFDSKAYSGGFEFTADDIKRFASYVNDFNIRYSQFFGRVFSFTVVSGHFNDSQQSISNRSDELYRLCNCKISCITSNELGTIVQMLQNTPDERVSIEWRNIFSEIVIEKKIIQQEINRIQKDKVH
ncbi:MAG: hypothetical protein ABSA44_04260 [Bacteroidota bacterium]|jgi:hypothetical protein